MVVEGVRETGSRRIYAANFEHHIGTIQGELTCGA